MKHIFVLFCCALLFSGCVKNNEKPVWISVDKWVLDPSDSPQSDIGQLTHNFSEVWVYVDNKIIGVFELPCKIPVIVSGNKKLQLYPAIKNNGISATKKVYPFVKPYEANIDFVPGQTYSFTPHTQYYDNVKCWKEDFTTNSFEIGTDPNSNAAIMLGNDPDISLGYTGNQYAQIILSQSDSLWIGYTTGELDLPSGKEVYLEIDYRNTNSMLTGVLAVSTANGSTTNPDILLNAQDVNAVTWKKIYIDLKEIVSYSASSSDYFEMYFRTLIDSGHTAGEVYIDNIKVVHFY